ncbi:Mitotic spindle assembly checkpoint protein MAD1 [Portunus trituberculatus]|uniref:Mitotic spindle assembly checkpoint protein MAD1 n=1 Tax=Portunus trituberculatus TaxID=210409 RepID=A0A5B7GHQ8_PORTR|nr:Mitotic spindle assembly checkpoint protein MAD1 [Portunus trituberculatus]
MREHTPAKEIQLLETDFSNNIEDLIDAYLRHENSYPAFLSAITLDLFNRQTKYQAHSSSEEEEEEVEVEMETDRKDIKRDGRMGNQETQKPGGGGGGGNDDDDDDDLVILD